MAPRPRIVARARRILAGVGALVLLGSCAGAGLWTDLTSVSVGRSNAGRVRKPARLPTRGATWVVPTRWRERGLRYGVDELVAAVVRVSQEVRARTGRRARLGVADLGPRAGGASPWHRSHQSGRDVDLLFYTRDGRGRPLPPPEGDMIRFGADGRPLPPRGEDAPYDDSQWASRRFDDRRNWALVEGLLSDPTVRVQWIFVSEPLKQRLLRYARRHERPPWVVAYAQQVLHQPGGSPPHDDHFHVRIYCTRADRFHGCTDTGPVWRHEKKAYKYYGPERYDPVMWRLALVAAHTW